MRRYDYFKVSAYEKKKFEAVSDFHEGLAIIQRNGKYGFIDKEGKEVIPCIFDGASDFHEGLARVKKDGNGNFVNKKGEELNLGMKKKIFYIQDASDLSNDYFNISLIGYVSAFETNDGQIIFIEEKERDKYLETITQVETMLLDEELNNLYQDFCDTDSGKQLTKQRSNGRKY